jgi:hypothetical protein
LSFYFLSYLSFYFLSYLSFYFLSYLSFMGSLGLRGGAAAAAAAPSPPGGWRGAMASMSRFVAPMRGYVAPALAVGAISGAFVLGAWIVGERIGERIGEGVQILKEGLDDIHRGTEIIHHADAVFDAAVPKSVAVAKAFNDTE